MNLSGPCLNEDGGEYQMQVCTGRFRRGRGDKKIVPSEAPICPIKIVSPILGPVASTKTAGVDPPLQGKIAS